MLTIIIYIVCLYLLVLLTWPFYLAAMMLKQHRNNLTGASKFFGYQVIYGIGYPLDFLLNIVASPIFLDLPRETTLTSRFKRYKGKRNWRERWSQCTCTQLLDQFDPSGDHC